MTGHRLLLTRKTDNTPTCPIFIYRNNVVQTAHQEILDCHGGFAATQ